MGFFRGSVLNNKHSSRPSTTMRGTLHTTIALLFFCGTVTGQDLPCPPKCTAGGGPGGADQGDVATGSMDQGDVATGSIDQGDVATGSMDKGDVATGSMDQGDAATGSMDQGDVSVSAGSSPVPEDTDTGDVATGSMDQGDVSVSAGSGGR